MARIRKVSDRIATYGCLNVQQYSHVVSVVGRYCVSYTA